jgi:dephospho-CoA kinase/inosine/xanthosine triphosphate pyrophosphatase family protein
MKKIYFLTSSSIKRAHAKHLAKDLEVEIARFFDYGKSYSEPRSHDRKTILNASFNDAIERIKRKRGKLIDLVFFIEDTSVVIRSLSAEHEVPGVDVKYWMRDMTFELLDDAIKRAGGDRSVFIRSDVLLFDGTLEQGSPVPKHFWGVTHGSITSKPLPIVTQSLYPWLDSRTFNKWFVPDGANLPLSALPIEQADLYDFRKNSIGAALEHLRKSGLIQARSHHPRETQKLLNFSAPKLYIICGHPCSGKTTMGELLSEECGFYYIEASDFMHYEHQKLHGLDASISLQDFAAEALREQPDIVAASVLDEIKASHAPLIAITGFRSEKEILYLKEKLADHDVQVVWIDALAKDRYRRSRARSRADALDDYQSFRARDLVQSSMGLDIIKKHHVDIKIENKSSLESYRTRVPAFLGARNNPREISQTTQRPKSLLKAIAHAIVLNNKREVWLTTTQIAHLINETYPLSDIAAHKDNVSRFFNAKPSPYFRIKREHGTNKFMLSSTGLSKSSVEQ